MSNTPILGAPELAASQALPESTVNEAVRYLEQGAAWFRFIDRDDTAPPGSPADGDCYLVAATATGAWAGHDGEIAFYMSTAWEFITPAEGMAAYILDEDIAVVFDGAAWNEIGGGTPAVTESIIIACSDETTAIATTGTKATFRMPYGFTVSEVRASVTGAAATGTLTIDINEGGASILSTLLTIDATEKTSTTAATPAVISDASLADDAEITIDLDDDADGTATGLKVVLVGQQT